MLAPRRCRPLEASTDARASRGGPTRERPDRPDLDRRALLEPSAVESFVFRLESLDELDRPMRDSILAGKSTVTLQFWPR